MIVYKIRRYQFLSTPPAGRRYLIRHSTHAVDLLAQGIDYNYGRIMTTVFLISYSNTTSTLITNEIVDYEGSMTFWIPSEYLIAIADIY